MIKKKLIRENLIHYFQDNYMLRISYDGTDAMTMIEIVNSACAIINYDY